MEFPATLLAAAGAVVLVDQASKWSVTHLLPEDRFYPVVPGSGLQRRVNRRPGLVPLSARAATIAAVLAAFVLAFVITNYPALPRSAAIGLGMAVGGALGNASDWILRGGVIDFITVRRWRTFNVADAAMVVGVAVSAASVM